MVQALWFWMKRLGEVVESQRENCFTGSFGSFESFGSFGSFGTF